MDRRLSIYERMYGDSVVFVGVRDRSPIHSFARITLAE